MPSCGSDPWSSVPYWNTALRGLLSSRVPISKAPPRTQRDLLREIVPGKWMGPGIQPFPWWNVSRRPSARTGHPEALRPSLVPLPRKGNEKGDGPHLRDPSGDHSSSEERKPRKTSWEERSSDTSAPLGEQRTVKEELWDEPNDRRPPGPREDSPP
ncbi:MAG: hypothetical protein JXA22_05390 [Candidatus Thermoplasmatota archaeon]|nr:hypothetical protein [Candidatus Thermoplasmatota archaeon]